MAATTTAMSAHGGSGLANVTGFPGRDRLEVLRYPLAIGVGHTLAAAGAEAVPGDRPGEASGDGGLGALECLGDIRGERLPCGVVLFECLGAWRRSAPLVLFRGGH